MTIALFRSWLFAAVPALLALLAIVTVSTWHAADLHDDRAHPVAGMAQVAVVQAVPAGDDASAMVHVAAHAIGHGMAMPQATATRHADVDSRQPWRIATATPLYGLAAPSPLKPPRA